MNRKRAVDKEILKRVKQIYADKGKLGDGVKFVQYAGISKSTFYNYMNGRSRIDCLFLKAFCKYFDVSANAILYGNEEIDR